jgi:hypothetical protein
MTPNPLQADVLRHVLRGAPLVSVMAGWGSGKTAAGAFAQAVLSEARPGTTRLAVTDTYGRAERVLLPTFDEWLAPEGWTAQNGGLVWGHKNGSRIRVVNYLRPSTRASTSNPLEGINAADAWVDECQALPPEVLAKVRGRVGRDGGHPGIILCTGLPVAGAWWVTAAERDPRGVVLTAESGVNAANLPADYIDQLRVTLSPEEFDAMVRAIPAAPRGQVLTGFASREWPAGNLLDASPDDYRDHDITAAVDFGLRPAVLLLAHDAGRDLDIVVDELQPDDVDVYELARLVRARGWRIAHAAGDPAGRARSDKDHRRSMQILAAELGVHFRWTREPDRIAIPAGLLTLNRRLCSADGRRRLAVLRSVWDGGDHGGRSLRRSVLGYRYPESGGEQPVKDGVTDHAIDAWRYWAINFRWLDKPVTPARGDYAAERVAGREPGRRGDWAPAPVAW